MMQIVATPLEPVAPERLSLGELIDELRALDRAAPAAREERARVAADVARREEEYQGAIARMKALWGRPTGLILPP